MNGLFMQILNMSITGSYCIIAVFFIRLLLKKQPKIFSYVLWSIVLFRLVCPVSFESMFSILHAKDINVSNGTGHQVFRSVNGMGVGYQKIDKTPLESPVISTASSAPDVEDIMNVTFSRQNILQAVWLTGVLGMFLYTIISTMKLKKSLKKARKEGDYYVAEQLRTPFVFGLIHPRIYLPYGLHKEELSYILEHEHTHIRRKDYLMKPLAFVVLSVHWFNPLVWLAFLYMEKDMEMSCDEAVIRKMGNQIKKDYSTSLLSIADGRMLFKGTPLAFGEGNVKGRIKNILSYKKPGFWGILIVTIFLIGIGVALVSNPKSPKGNMNKAGENKDTQIVQGTEDNLIKNGVSQSPQPTVLQHNSKEKQAPIYGSSDRDKVKKFLKSYGELKEIPKKQDDMVVYTGKSVGNAERLEKFYENAQNQIEDAIVILIYTIEGEPCLNYLSYHNGQYYYMQDTTRDTFGSQGYYEDTGKYMMCYPNSGQLYYYLTDSQDITYQQIWEEELSSVKREKNFCSICKLDYSLLEDGIAKWAGKDLEANVSNAIISANQDKTEPVFFNTEAHHIIKIVDNKFDTIVYTHALYKGFNKAGVKKTGSYVTVAITFDKDENGNYTLKEYWIPKDGGLMKESIKQKFPKDIWKYALDAETCFEQLERECRDKEIDYFENNKQ